MPLTLLASLRFGKPSLLPACVGEGVGDEGYQEINMPYKLLVALYYSPPSMTPRYDSPERMNPTTAGAMSPLT